MQSFGRILFGVALAVLVGVGPSTAAVQDIYAVNPTKQLLKLNTSATIVSTLAITGPATAESVYGIDYRPATGGLYLLVGTPEVAGTSILGAKIYSVNPVNGVATAISASGTNISTVGKKVGFDIDPAADEIRVVSDSGQNLRFSPSDGSLLGTESQYSASGSICEIAYDRNTTGSALSTLFALQDNVDRFLTLGGENGVPSPNNGQVFGESTINFNIDNRIGMDADDGLLYVILHTDGDETELKTVSITQVLQLASGVPFTHLGTIAGNPEIVGMTVVPQPVVVPPPSLEALTVTKTSVKLNFAKAGTDSILISGILPVPADFAVTGQELVINFGGVLKTFTLDAKGKAKVGLDSVSVKVKNKKGVVAAQDAPFKISLKGGSFAADLEDEGLTNSDETAKSVSITVTVEWNGSAFQKVVPLTYKAKTGKTGKAK